MGMDTTVDMTYSSSALLTVAISNFNASLFPGIWVFSLMNYVVIWSYLYIHEFGRTRIASYFMAVSTGLEPVTSAVTVQRSSQNWANPPEKDATYTESPTANYRMNTEPFISGYSSPRWMPTHIQWQEKEINYIYATFG